MANYTTVVTDAGTALLTRIANAAGALSCRAVKCGSGQVGETDPETLTDIITQVQTSNVIDIKLDDDGLPYLYFTLSNDGLETGYTRNEIGIFGREIADPADTLIIYLYAQTEEQADYIPPEADGVATQTFRVQLAAAQGLEATVNIDQSIVYLSLDRWADHLDGAGAADQHPVATSATPGLMSTADKTKIDAHINVASPTSGAAIHGNATQAVPGFESAADKTKLDGIAAGAEVNQNAFGIVKIGETSIVADAKADTLEMVSGANISITPDAGNDKVTIAAVDITPSSHIGSGGAAHAAATQVVAGFLSAADKTKLDGLDNANYVKLTGDQSIAGTKTFNDPIVAADSVSPISGANFMITPEGGFAVRLVNKTGASSIRGTMVVASTTYDMSFELGSNYSPLGFVWESGVADAQFTWVVVAGIAPMFVLAGQTAVLGQYVELSGTAGKVKSSSDIRSRVGIWLESGIGDMCSFGLIQPTVY